MKAFAYAAAAGKVLQFSAVLLWFAGNRPDGFCLDTQSVQLYQFMTFLLLFALGQNLNYATIHAIGVKGVYYGTKLGEEVPWFDGFPFDVYKHPQYIGSALSVWAVAILVWNQTSAQIVTVAIYWTALYLVTAIWEDRL